MLGYFEGMPVVHFSNKEMEHHPRWLDASNLHPVLTRQRKVTAYKSLLDFAQQRRPKKILFYRTYALGDILMLLPVVRAIHRALALDSPICIAVKSRFADQLRGLNDTQKVFRFLPDRGIGDYGADVHMNLNGCLESDHWGGDDSHKHRIVLYCNALGLEVA